MITTTHPSAETGEAQSGHAEQAFCGTGSDSSRCGPSAPSSPEPRRISGSLKPPKPRNGSISESTRPTVARCAERVRDRTIRVDRGVPEIHHSLTAGGAKPQVTGPDEFSAPTRCRAPRVCRATCPSRRCTKGRARCASPTAPTRCTRSSLPRTCSRSTTAAPAGTSAAEDPVSRRDRCADGAERVVVVDVVANLDGTVALDANGT
jgi:hypothetical protein